jgi:2-keto-4-pentenoate hydratase/2-oxohepta-3-ene-1,7-dioic acid hydratase in catechol pathway
MPSVPAPQKIVCVGLNYRAHATEAGRSIPAEPLLFAKLPNTIIGPGDPIRLPPESDNIDFEAELAVVVGRRATRVGRDDAFDHIAGYACFNDVTARDLQRRDGQWTRGKSFDSFGPLGPLVPAAEIPDPHALGVVCRIDDEVVQRGSTADMIFSIPEIFAYVTAAITLEPGDVIATGTPAGIGAFHTPPRWLTDGDVVEVEIDQVGRLSNPVVSFERRA